MDDGLTDALAAAPDAAFERLVGAHADRVYTIALRVLGNRADAEEVAQDAFVRAHRAILGYEAERIRSLELRPWLATIVVNLCRNRLRRRVPPTVPLDHGDGPEPGAAARSSASLAAGPDDRPEEHVLRSEATAAWAARLAALPVRLRVPVILRHVDGLSYDEIAQALGRPEGTVKAQVHRGIAQLRAALEPAEAEREEMTA